MLAYSLILRKARHYASCPQKQRAQKSEEALCVDPDAVTAVAVPLNITM